MKTTYKTKRNIGVVLSALPVLFLALDGVMKLVDPLPVRESFATLGIPNQLAGTIGVLELACLTLYLVPRTAPLGAVLLTGFLGGAIATHTRNLDPLFSQTIFPLYVALPLWAGLILRDERIFAIFAGILRGRDASSKSARAVSIRSATVDVIREGESR